VRDAFNVKKMTRHGLIHQHIRYMVFPVRTCCPLYGVSCKGIRDAKISRLLRGLLLLNVAQAVINQVHYPSIFRAVKLLTDSHYRATSL
jgi:hypothetical protein